MGIFSGGEGKNTSLVSSAKLTVGRERLSTCVFSIRSVGRLAREGFLSGNCPEGGTLFAVSGLPAETIVAISVAIVISFAEEASNDFIILEGRLFSSSLTISPAVW